jgi:hypothetical protein
LSNSRSIDLCFLVISIVFVKVSPLAGNLIFRVVIVLAMPNTLSTLNPSCSLPPQKQEN